MRLGCNTVLFSKLDLPEALRRVEWCGFKEVELAAIPGMCEHVVPGRDEPAQVQTLLEEAGLRAVAIEAATNLTDPANLPRFISVLRFAAALGVEVVNTGSGGKTGDAASEQAAYAAIRQLAPIAADLGVRVGVKAHVNQAIDNTARALQALDAIPIEGWGINFDASHLYRLGDDIVESARQLGPRLASVHIRDTLELVIPIGPPQTQIAGRGSIDLPGVLQALQQANYSGPINLEVIGGAKLEDWQASAVAAESHGYLSRIMRTLDA